MRDLSPLKMIGSMLGVVLDINLCVEDQRRTICDDDRVVPLNCFVYNSFGKVYGEQY